MRKRAAAELFGLSFLDVISCSFAAMLALLLLAKNEDSGDVLEVTSVIIDNSIPLGPMMEENQRLQARRDDIEAEKSQLFERQLEMTSELDAVRSAVSAAIAKPTNTPVTATVGSMDSIYAGGVPVGAENIIFIIDTSGSMQAYWGYVVQTLDRILKAHPKFNGLQILSDNGEYLIPGYAGILMPDTNAARARATEKLNTWNALSNSSPAEGLELALKTYASKTESLAIYVFGDDFTGDSYDEVLSVVDRWNVDEKGQRKAAIHGVGFPWGIGNRYATLMRELAYRNRGVFVGL